MQKYFSNTLLPRDSIDDQDKDALVSFLLNSFSFMFDSLISYKDPFVHRVCTLIVYLTTTYQLTDNLIKDIELPIWPFRHQSTNPQIDAALRAYYCDEYDSYEDYIESLGKWEEYHDLTRIITDHFNGHEFNNQVIFDLVELCISYNQNLKTN